MANEDDFTAIYRPRKPYETKPFDSSAVNYDEFAQMMERTISTFDQGIVIAIDAPWGYGKSYFGRNFSALLSTTGWTTTYLDTFEHDYVEDPFLLIASTIIGDIAPAKSKPTLIKAASNVGKTLLPIAAKAAVRVGTLAAVDAKDLEDIKNALTEAGGEAAEKLVEKRLQDFAKEREGIAEFRKQLTDLARKVKDETGHPLVVFIDELDRCQPTFAVRTLERIKHFFDVPYLSFVFLLNRKQLESAVNGVYGQSVDSATYLTKFVHFFIPLPRGRSKNEGEVQVERYVKYLGSKISISKHQPQLKSFVEVMADIAPAFGLSMRDVERAFTQFVLAIAGRSMAENLVPLLAFVVAVRIVAPTAYQGILEKDDALLNSVIASIEKAKLRGLHEGYTLPFGDMLVAYVRGQNKIAADSPLRRILHRVRLEPERAFSFFAELLDHVPNR
jgi:hypothetical protein